MQTVKPQFFISYVWRMRYIFPEFLRKIFKIFHVSQNNWTELTDIAFTWLVKNFRILVVKICLKIFPETETEYHNISAAGFSPPPVVFCSPGQDFPWCSSTQQLLLIIKLHIKYYTKAKAFLKWSKSGADIGKRHREYVSRSIFCQNEFSYELNMRRPSWYSQCPPCVYKSLLKQKGFLWLSPSSDLLTARRHRTQELFNKSTKIF